MDDINNNKGLQITKAIYDGKKAKNLQNPKFVNNNNKNCTKKNKNNNNNKSFYMTMENKRENNVNLPPIEKKYKKEVDKLLNKQMKYKKDFEKREKENEEKKMEEINAAKKHREEVLERKKQIDLLKELKTRKKWEIKQQYNEKRAEFKLTIKENNNKKK